MNAITYILGAGASYHSMPLVESFKDRFSVFIDFIKSFGMSSHELYYESESFLENIKAHASFDTYFKKLFHQNRITAIHRYKKVLLAFFLFEHLIDLKTYSGLAASHDVNKEFNIDPRYDALIAGLLKPIPRTQFYTDVNFITWNYDMNLMLALKNFVAPSRRMEDFFDDTFQETYFQITKQVTLVHLNGYAFHPLLNNVFAPGEVIHESFMQLFSTFLSPDFDQHAMELRFAWEEKGFDPVSVARNLVESSSTIIIIGYSLPLYNRLFDNKLLNDDVISRKDLIIQDVNAKTIESILMSDFDMKSLKATEESSLTLHENCHSFIVPRRIFN